MHDLTITQSDTSDTPDTPVTPTSTFFHGNVLEDIDVCFCPHFYGKEVANPISVLLRCSTSADVRCTDNLAVITFEGLEKTLTGVKGLAAPKG